MLTGKWYKVYWKPGSLHEKARTITVWAFDLNSAAATAKIKVAQKNPLYSEEKIIITRVDKLTFDSEKN